jgi:hypothetical protein
MGKIGLGEGFGQLDFALAATTTKDDRISIRNATDGSARVINENYRI